jgi:hypothetical protein
MIPLADTLYIIKENAIYGTKLADKIDPCRSNIAIPNVQQKVASEGSGSDIVCRILLTGHELFNKSYLVSHVNREECLSICIKVLQDFLAMKELAVGLRHEEEEAIKSMQQKADGSLLLPAIPDVIVQAKTFIQRAAHLAQSLYVLCSLFYREELKREGKWFDGFSALINQKYGEADEFSRFSRHAAQCCKFLKNTRHCIEHEKTFQRIDVRDFSLLPTGEIKPPTIEVVHSETPEPEIPLYNFMEQISESLLNLTELLIAFLCSKNVQNIGGLPVQVGEVPENQRRNTKIRYGYVVWFGDQLVKAS